MEGRLSAVDLEINVDGLTIVELTHRFRVALLPVELGIDLIINIRGEGREAIGAVLTDDVSFYGAGSRVGEVDDSVGQRRVLVIDDPARQEAAVIVFLFRGQARGRS